MKKLLYALLLLFSQLLISPAYAEYESADGDINFCEWLSVLAREIMIARQNRAPMSETLPWVLDRLEMMPSALGVDPGELDHEGQVELEEFLQSLELPITRLVADAYRRSAWDVYDLKRDAIDNFENEVLSQCHLNE